MTPEELEDSLGWIGQHGVCASVHANRIWKHIETLQAERDNLAKDNSEIAILVSDVSRKLGDAEGRLKLKTAALERYGSHLYGCPKRSESKKTCTCGLDAAKETQ